VTIELDSITKIYGSLRANDGIDLTVPPSSVLGILGENGAGKSTLMKILSGFIAHDEGTIRVDGKPVAIGSPSDAIALGIGMLHQDPLDFLSMTLADNFILGRPGGFFPDRRAAARELRELSARFGFDLDPDSYVENLTVGERQQLEILRLFSLGARVLILDEPTTGISLPQKAKLFETLKRLAQEGMSILFVSHKLEDVEALCSGAAVLRKGALVGEVKAPFDTRELVRLMFGRDLDAGELAEAETAMDGGAPGEPVLRARDICIESGRLSIRGVDFAVAPGEVIAFAGMEGSGQDVFLGACAGLVRHSGGKFYIASRDMGGRSHHDYKRAGVGYLPAARLEKALVPGLNLEDHFALTDPKGGFFIDRKKARKVAEERIASFKIKGSPESPVESLSGGNQQRALLSLLAEKLSLVLVEHPTRGLDIESTAYVWDRLKTRCAGGAAIVFISSDLDEVLRYADRVVVFYAGKVSPPIPASRLSTERLGELIGGKGWEALGETEAPHA